MHDDPVIVVHSKEQAVAALDAAHRADVAVLLLSQRGGASVWGGPVFYEMMRLAAAAVPSAVFRYALDCGHDAGWAMAAVRSGIAGIVFDPASPAFARIVDIAEQAGSFVLTPEVYDRATLDLSQVGDPERACDSLLLGGAK